MSDSVHPKARQLAVTSFAVALYVLGGAQIAKGGTLLGGSVEFSRPSVLEYAAVTLLVFYLYRYCVAMSWSVWSNVEQDKSQFISGMEFFTKHVTTKGNSKLSNLLRNNNNTYCGIQYPPSDQSSLTTVWLRDRNSIVYGVFNRRTSVNVVRNHSVTGDPIKSVRISWWKAETAETLAFFKTAVYRESVWNDLLPIYLFLIAGALILARLFGFL